MATSFLLTVGVAIFGYRGNVASADQRGSPPAAPAAPASRSNGLTLVREIGGPARTATPAPGSNTAATIQTNEEPRPLLRLQVDASAGAPPPIESASESEVAGAAPPPISRPASASSSSSQSRVVAPNSPPPTPESPPSPTPTGTPLPTAIPQMMPTSLPSATPVATKTSPTPTPTATGNTAPTVTLRLSDARVDSGDSVSITVIALDDKGVDWIAWEATGSGERALDREHRHECDRRSPCAQTWTVHPNQDGLHTIVARARDADGLRSDTASAQLRVRDRPAPTRTPTASPSTSSQARSSAPTRTP